MLANRAQRRLRRRRLEQGSSRLRAAFATFCPRAFRSARPGAERREPDMKFTFQENNRSEGLQQGFGGKVRPNRRTVPGNTAKSHLEGMSSGKVFFGFGPRPKRWQDGSCRRIPARLESASGLVRASTSETNSAIFSCGALSEQKYLLNKL